MTLDDLNAMDEAAARRALLRCCGSSRWAARMAMARPFNSFAALRVTADVVWSAVDEPDWREAFAAHPTIGGSRPAPASGERSWSSQEQAGVASASASVVDRLAAKNAEYEARFGYIFIVCATGKTADEMLALLERRLSNAPADELRVAAEEQRQITQLRLARLLTESDAR